jgi:Raf kinase inhibitor-like YbhB/YbcL family protein
MTGVGIDGSNSWGATGYGGPCPPGGTHRYFFKLYALDLVLELDPGADKEALLQAMEGHVLGEAELMGTYSR